MRSTLFFIPDQLLGVPVFGFGWLLGLWALLSIVTLAWMIRRDGLSNETLGFLPLLGLFGLAIAFLLPLLEETSSDGTPIGLPIRGYGVMMLLGLVSGVLLAAYRARQMGLDPEVIFSLAFWMFIAGIIGARLFHVVEYWDQFAKYDDHHNLNLVETVKALANVTQGGLVVYGSVIGGVLAGYIFLRRRKLPILAIGDVIAPSMVLGLALGRVGCFLNGCCFGGVCDGSALGVTFPPGSPPFFHQLETGALLDVEWRLDKSSGERIVEHVHAGGLGDAAGLKSGDRIRRFSVAGLEDLREADRQPAADPVVLSVTMADGQRLSWSLHEFPARSLPVYPTQIFSAINAALICLFLWFYYPLRRRDGEVFVLLILIYPVTRFVLEMIRSDEVGQFGTSLTISQWLSIVVLIAAVGLWFHLRGQPSGSALPRST